MEYGTTSNPLSSMMEVKHQLPLSHTLNNVSSFFITIFVDTETMSYFRALFKAMEISSRALDLSRETILLNQGNYAAWHYRRKLLHELKVDLMTEISWLNSIGLMMEKNYQIWHHRRCIFEMLAR